MELPDGLPVVEDLQVAPLPQGVAPVEDGALLGQPTQQEPRRDAQLDQVQIPILQPAPDVQIQIDQLLPLNNVPLQGGALNEVPIPLPQEVPIQDEQVVPLNNVPLEQAPLDELPIPLLPEAPRQDEQIVPLEQALLQEGDEVPLAPEAPLQPPEVPQQAAPRRSFASGRVVSVHFECHCSDEDLARMRAELKAWPRGLDGGEDCCPPLLHAVVKEHPRCVAFLLEMGADVNKEYAPLGETPLSSSVTRSTPELARMLLARDSSGVNARSSLTKEPPLVRAIKHGNTETVRLLLQHGARPDVCALRNEEEVPAVFLAVQLGHEAMVRLLLDHGASLHGHAHFDKHNALFKHVQFAVSEGQVESLRALCLHGALRELRKVTLYPNLSRSIHCNFPIVCVLLRNENPLEVSLRTLDLLCEFGFNFWQCDKHDKEAWHKAEKMAGNNDFAKLLTYKMRRLRTRPLTLKMLCRLRLQEQMGRRFVSSARQLQIPETLYPFLLFENV